MARDFTALIEDARQHARTDPLELTVRELLAAWNAKRRGVWIVNQINRDLVDAGLTTSPSFTEGWIDNTIRIVPYEPASPETNGSDEAPPEGELRAMLRVGDLPSANTGVVSVPPDASLELTQSLMLRDDFSQLAVLSGERNLRGAVSWESIALAGLRKPDATLKDATVPTDPVELDQDLLAMIPRIVDEGFLFVRSRDQRLSGIVTMADLSIEFSNLATPFFLLGEIERRLRRTIDECFSADDLRAVLAPDDPDREVQAAQDLTFGEYGRLLEDPSKWPQLSWSVDRKTFVDRLNEVRHIRNDVMHFSPDPLDDDQVSVLRNFIRWLRVLDPRP